MCSCTSPAGRLESHQRGFWIETLVLCPGDLLSKSSIFSRKRWWGDSPLLMTEEVGGKHNTVKQADSGLGRWMLRKFQGEPLKPDHVFAFCQASFRMTLSWVGFPMLAPVRIVSSFWQCYFFQSKNMVYVSICLCHLWYQSSASYSFMSTVLLTF